MYTMNRIDLKNEDLKKIHHLFEGRESYIYPYKDDKLLKIYKPTEHYHGDNKIDKLEILSNLDIDENVFRDLVYIDGYFSGFTMDDLTKKGYKQTCALEGKDKERIEILKKTWERLEKLHEFNIIFGDISEHNILYNGNNIIFCDMDNAYINKLDFDVQNVYQFKYRKSIKDDLSLLDNYIFNIHTIAYYQKIYYVYVFEILGRKKFKKQLNNEECEQIAHDMLVLNDLYNGELFIDHLHESFKRKLKRTFHLN